MSDRHDNYKGSSRSTRDDSRQHRDGRRDHRDEYDRRRSRSRSRSPRRKDIDSRSSIHSSRSSRISKDSHEKEHRDYDKTKRDYRKSPNEWDSSEEEVPAPPPPPRITKISIDLSKPKAPIKMNIGGPVKAKSMATKPTVAAVFNNDDDDDEPEEMPAEARMRMRNIGRETPTSAGPNSFGKTKQGFCDAKKVFEKNLKNALETTEKPSMSKFPQTIYKIKGP